MRIPFARRGSSVAATSPNSRGRTVRDGRKSRLIVGRCRRIVGGAEMDAVDERLVALLKEDARLSMADLGRRVGLSRTATLARVRRLEETGAIRGYHADTDSTSPEAHVA